MLHILHVQARPHNRASCTRYTSSMISEYGNRCLPSQDEAAAHNTAAAAVSTATAHLGERERSPASICVMWVWIRTPIAAT